MLQDERNQCVQGSYDTQHQKQPISTRTIKIHHKLRQLQVTEKHANLLHLGHIAKYTAIHKLRQLQVTEKHANFLHLGHIASLDNEQHSVFMTSVVSQSITEDGEPFTTPLAIPCTPSTMAVERYVFE
jgi:hypothetical protein